MISFVPTIFFVFGCVFDASAQFPSFQKNGVDQEKVRHFEDHLLSAKSVSSEYILELEKLDITEAKSSFDNLSFEEKEYATEFPFLETWVVDRLIKLQGEINRVKVSFIYNIPPDKQELDSEVWDKLLKTKSLTIVLDDKEVLPDVLIDYSPNDFALYELVQIQKGGLFSKDAFEVKLTTHEKYHEDFILSRKELHTISAQFSNGEEMTIPYFMIERTFFSDLEGRLVPNYPVNYLGIILDEILNQDFDTLLERSKRLDNAPGIWMYYKKADGEEYKLFVKY